MNVYLIVSLIALTSIYGVCGKSVCQRNTNFDVALLSIQWAPGVCATTHCKRHGNDFLIHGMWPNYKNNTHPSDCCYQQHLDKGVLAPILSEMEKHWPSLMNDNDNWDFWIHEWKKHGTCAEKSAFIGQFNYFNKTLHLFEEIDLPSWLSTAGIRPSNAGVSLGQFREAIQTGFTKRPQIACKGRTNELPILTEIRLCYNPITVTPIDCPKESRSCRSKTGKIAIIPA